MSGDLVEFLLARIADSRELAYEVEGETSDLTVTRLADYVRAECDAKRRIVEECVGDLRDRGDGALEGRVGRTTWDVLCLLALPYADHRDYREEWKP